VVQINNLHIAAGDPHYFHKQNSPIGLSNGSIRVDVQNTEQNEYILVTLKIDLNLFRKMKTKSHTKNYGNQECILNFFGVP
jgi:hypothetical protein